jgi:large subunit ribosomal protein L4
MEAAVYSIQGETTGRSVELADNVFGLETPNDHAIYQDVRLIQANRRQGTSKAKERSEVHGTGKKPYRQKGTGNARAGDRKSPLWRHGGTTFGPRPRNHGFRLNRKEKVLARRSALSHKAKNEAVKVVENFEFEAPKTREFLSILRSLELVGKKVLVVLPEKNENLFLSGRNLPKTQVLMATDLNTYDIINADTVLFLEDAVSIVNERLAK